MTDTDSAPPHAEPLYSRSNPQVTKVGFLASKENWQWVQEYSARNGIRLSGVLNKAIMSFRQRVT